MSKVRIAALAGILLAGQALAATPEARYGAALAELNKHCSDFCGFRLGKDPAEVKALDALWDASQDWTVAYLAAHPVHDSNQLQLALAKYHRSGRDLGTDPPRDSVAPLDVIALAPDLYAFAAQWGETGNVFLVAKRDGQFHVVWDIRKTGHGPFTLLESWRSGHARSDCDQNTDRLNCGPVYGLAAALKPDAQGRPRFVVLGTYAQMAGATVAGQFSFWRWDGDHATPLLADRYIYMADDSAGRDSGNTYGPNRVTLRVKDSFKSFMACGACVGRQLDWTFRILPDRIVDEGKKPVVPELDAVDAILSRFLHGQPAGDLASPAAIATLNHMFEASEGAGDNLGMEGDRQITPTKTGADVCLATDGFFATHFLLDRHGSGFTVREVRLTKSHSCTQPAKK